MKINPDAQLTTDSMILSFVAGLRTENLSVHLSADDEVTLKLGDTVIADFVEPRIHRYEPAGIGYGLIECSLDYGSATEMEPTVEDEIPKMKIRIYKMVLRDGKIVRDVPDEIDRILNDDGIDVDFGDSDYAPVEGETILAFSELKYTFVREP